MNSTRTFNPLALNQMSPNAIRELHIRLLDFIDVATTATNRATFYNSKQESQELVEAIHGDMIAAHRGIYTLAAAIPGATDYTQQRVLFHLLSKKRTGSRELPGEVEQKVIEVILQRMPTHRALNAFLNLQKAGVNNARTRRTILAYCLNAPKLDFWAIKYRRKLATLLRHVWGVRNASIIRKILAKDAEQWTVQEQGIIGRQVHKFVRNSDRLAFVGECVGFVLGTDRAYSQHLFQAFEGAKKDLNRGKALPYEVLEGIRSTYHPRKSNAEVLKLTKENLTVNQQKNFQRKAEVERTEVHFDPNRYQPMELYRYAFQMGMTTDIQQALIRKARQAAENSEGAGGKVAIVLDTSLSMKGSDEQEYLAISRVLAIRDMLATQADDFRVYGLDRSQTCEPFELVECTGETSVADRLLDALLWEPDQVYMLTDGYENTPAGRVDEVMEQVREMGIETPVMQVNPVSAKESGSVRKLSLFVTMLPMSLTSDLTLGQIRVAVADNLEVGLNMIWKKTQYLFEPS
ncbi:hypothetical protein [Pontibacter sp. G13]|uniref:hypothetical protein n=1 Tax=Pontibacter sp. G13 TaxID=3074898 RepID=UPI00288A2FA4|nr:hypothetical protein [Pontibacter sp. G13]WNJ17321.1 hypothetical protein RJD25_20925 [Pontibacter sp. G13]